MPSAKTCSVVRVIRKPPVRMTFYVICQGGFEDYLSCSLLHISLNWTLAKLCIWISFRASLPPYRIDYCCIGGMAGVYFLVYSFMMRITSFPTDMNNLWIDRWYMWQDWIRVALVATDITSLFYIENCKKSKTSHLLLIHGQNAWVEIRVSFTAKKREKYRL